MSSGCKPGFALGICLIAAAAPPAFAQPLDEVVQRALKNNRDYLAGLQRVREAEALLRQAGMRPAPTIEGTGGSSTLMGSPGTQEYSIGYFHPFETGGKRDRRQDVAKLGVELARAEAAEKKRQLTFEVRQRYAEAANAQYRAGVLAEVARINAETFRLIAARVQEGDAAPLEKNLLQIEIDRAEADRILLQAKGEAALLELKRTGGLPDSASALEPESAAATSMPSLDEAVRLALENRPDLLALRTAEQQASSGVALALAEGAPDITASARYGYRSATFDQSGFDSTGALTPVRDRDSVLAFGFSVPLFTRRRNQGNVEAAVSREREAKLRREYLASAIALEVRAAWRKWDAAVRALGQLERNVLRQAGQNLAVIREAWQLGQLRFIDVLNEQRRFTELRLARADAQTDAMKAAAELAHSMGGEIR